MNMCSYQVKYGISTDSDFSECASVEGNSADSRLAPKVPAKKTQVALPRSVPNHLLLISVLEQLCIMYSRDSKQSLQIFKCKLHYQGFRFFQDWWAKVTLGAKNGGPFSEMMGPSISN